MDWGNLFITILPYLIAGLLGGGLFTGVVAIYRAVKMTPVERDSTIVTSAQGVIVSMEKSLEAAERRADRAEARVTVLEGVVATLEGKIDQLEAQVRALISAAPAS